MNLAKSLDQIVRAEMRELEAQGVFELCDKHEWAIDRYCELYDEAMADEADDCFENDWFWNELIGSGSDYTEDLKMMYAEYCDSYAANEWGDQLLETGEDPWPHLGEDELCVQDIERDAAIDAAIEMQAICDAAAREEAFIKDEEERAKRAKENRRKWNL